MPVSPALEPYASYPVSHIEFCERNGATTLSYDLPELLVGASDKLSFAGIFDASRANLVLTGDQGTATCHAEGTSWSCSEALTSVEVRKDKLRDQLATLPAAEAQGRSDVSDVFSQDPIGVLAFTTE